MNHHRLTALILATLTVAAATTVTMAPASAASRHDAPTALKIWLNGWTDRVAACDKAAKETEAIDDRLMPLTGKAKSLDYPHLASGARSAAMSAATCLARVRQIPAHSAFTRRLEATGVAFASKLKTADMTLESAMLHPGNHLLRRRAKQQFLSASMLGERIGTLIPLPAKHAG